MVATGLESSREQVLRPLRLLRVPQDDNPFGVYFFSPHRRCRPAGDERFSNLSESASLRDKQVSESAVCFFLDIKFSMLGSSAPMLQR